MFSFSLNWLQHKQTATTLISLKPHFTDDLTSPEEGKRPSGAGPTPEAQCSLSESGLQQGLWVAAPPQGGPVMKSPPLEPDCLGSCPGAAHASFGPP